MAEEPLILIVDDDESVLEAMQSIVIASGLGRVEAMSDPRHVLPFFEERRPDVLVLDQMMPHISGIELMRKVIERYPEVPVILSTARSDVAFAVECMRNGAFDFVLKGSDPTPLMTSVRHALDLRDLKSDYKILRDSLLSPGPGVSADESFPGIVTRNAQMGNILRYIASVAPSVKPVLVTGESGTGKELIARAIHARSGRPGQLVGVNVAGMDDTLFSDTFFGHKRGAFTGADSERTGLVHQAEGGTLFLDEIGDLSLMSQVKLLKLIEEKEYFPLGSARKLSADVKIVAATNRDLQALSDAKLFRHDLMYRLDTHRVTLPPLRKRRDDIPDLVAHFVSRACESLGRADLAIPGELFKILDLYDFPGNVRELESMVYDAASQARSSVLPLESFKAKVFKECAPSPVQESTCPDKPSDFFSGMEKLPSLRELNRAIVEEAMRRAGDNQGIAARLLGLSRTALNRRLKAIREGEDEE